MSVAILILLILAVLLLLQACRILLVIARNQATIAQLINRRKP